MTNQAIHLRVKIKNLVDEARTIKLEERRALKQANWYRSKASEEYQRRTSRLPGEPHGLLPAPVTKADYALERAGFLYRSLREHRLSVVRDCSRHNLLAYAILRGTPYFKVEAKCAEPFNAKEVTKIATRFGADEKDIAAWMVEAGRSEPVKPTPVATPAPAPAPIPAPTFLTSLKSIFGVT